MTQVIYLINNLGYSDSPRWRAAPSSDRLSSNR